MSQPAELLLAALRRPASTVDWDTTRWEILLRLLQRTALTARFGARLRSAGQMDRVPLRVQDQCQAALIATDANARAVSWEIDRIGFALRDIDCPLVLLKGAAYLVLDMPLQGGRACTDVDILVPRGELALVEQSLLKQGWVGIKSDEYDQHYYRQWMHELPPLRHSERDLITDLHHNILPLTGRVHIDPATLLSGTQAVPGSRFHVLAPVDMFLHSAAHLFQDGEIYGALRDLLDIDDFLRLFAASPGFWSRLVPRANELGLQRPLYYALHYAGCLLETPVPDEVRNAAEAARPSWAASRMMDLLVPAAFAPRTAEQPLRSDELVRTLLYLRSHWLRMPAWLLLRHLAHKAVWKPKPA